MRQLTEREVYDIMHSDMQLWDQSETEAKGNDVLKRINLPFGIGLVEVQFNGVDNGVKRRAALEQWGAYVRQTVKDRIDDEAVTSRARQAAALKEADAEAEEVVSTDSGHGSDGQRTDGVKAATSPANPKAVQAHADTSEEDAPAGTDFFARGEWLRGRIGRAEADLAKWRKELRAIDAALEILNASEDS